MICKRYVIRSLKIQPACTIPPQQRSLRIRRRGRHPYNAIRNRPFRIFLRPQHRNYPVQPVIVPFVDHIVEICAIVCEGFHNSCARLGVVGDESIVTQLADCGIGGATEGKFLVEFFVAARVDQTFLFF